MSRLRDWRDTAIWSELETRCSLHADGVRATLITVMPGVQSVLHAAGTAPADFTLHDAQHSFRVAERMTDLLRVPNLLGQLTVHELALLLLSAYLHDIGMTPERSKILAHRQYLLTGQHKELTDEEFNQFQEWLDDYGEDVEPPVPAERIRIAEELVAYYCRHKHNDWSEEWIRQHLGDEELGNYSDWVDDVVALCRSHSEAYGELIEPRFNPIQVPACGAMVHRRYLAVLLRIADVLDLDPERTPQVILRQRAIASDSLIYWWRDHDISLTPDGNSFNLVARPPNAQIHRAAEVMADDIDRELALCRRLADDTHFENCPGTQQRLPHTWPFDSSVHRTFEPKHNAYEYINGAFRPDTKKLLDLFSGTQLYGTEMAAVRELLQNAFDAVREEIAYERLAALEQGRPDPEEEVAKLHQVTLRLEHSGDVARLVCTDNGVGMTRKIITDHLLVSGAARRHDILKLERRCKQKGFLLGRSGEFGIGVLSYFMLGDHVEITTRRSVSAGDDEGHGWAFVTDGVGSFGELRKHSPMAPGTRVAITLRPKMDTVNLSWFAMKVLGYLKDTLANTPCRFTFDPGAIGDEGLSLAPGWCWSEADAAAAIRHRIERQLRANRPSVSQDLLSRDERQALESSDSRAEELVRKVAAALHFASEEGEMRDARGLLLGAYRIRLPYFCLPGGPCLAFLDAPDIEDALSFRELQQGEDGVAPPGDLAFSWQGQRITRALGVAETDSPEVQPSAAVEVDFRARSAAAISVDRGELRFTDAGREALRTVAKKALEARIAFAQSHPDSAYAWLNRSIAGCEPAVDLPVQWIGSHDRHENGWTWSTHPYPVAWTGDDRLEARDKSAPSYVWRGKVAPHLADFRLSTGPEARKVPVSRRFSHCVPILPSPDCPRLALILTKSKAPPPDLHGVGCICDFPPQWEHLLSAHFRGRLSAWNARHIILRLLTEPALDWARGLLYGRDDNPLTREGEFADAAHAAAWIALCTIDANARRFIEPPGFRVLEIGEGAALWTRLAHNRPTFLQGLWDLIFSTTQRAANGSWTPLVVYGSRYPADEKVRVYTPDGIREATPDDLESYLPDPGPDWRLEPQE